jgi:hypothetical protein
MRRFLRFWGDRAWALGRAGFMNVEQKLRCFRAEDAESLTTDGTDNTDGSRGRGHEHHLQGDENPVSGNN